MQFPVIEGFDNYSSPADLQTRVGDLTYPSAGVGAFFAGAYGGNAMQAVGVDSSVGAACTAVLAVPQATVYHGLRANTALVTANGTSFAWISVHDGVGSGGNISGLNGWQFVLQLNPTLGQFSLVGNTGNWYPGGGVSLGSSSNGLFPAAEWFFLEFEVDIPSAGTNSGTVTVWVNGIEVWEISAAINPMATGTAGLFTYGMQPGNADSWLLDDCYWNTPDGIPYAGRLGDGQALCYFPTSNNSVQWTSSSAEPNYQNVNQKTQTVLSNQSLTPGQIDLFNVGGVPNGVIKAVSVKGQSYKTNAAGRTMSWLLKSGSVTSTGTAFGLNSSATVSSYQVNEDPNTSAAWTVPNLNLALAGYEEES